MEQLELHPVPEDAARQVIDATRLFKEYLRVRKELKGYDGSMFWKPVDPYEYLVHRTRGKLKYEGRRGPDTEASYDRFIKQKARLSERFKSLKEAVDTAQRMNRALHAGAVPSDIIDLLQTLDDLGLAEKTIILGSPAMHAYQQAAGVKLQLNGQGSVRGKQESLLPKDLTICIEDSAPSVSVAGIKYALRKLAAADRGWPPKTKGLAIEMKAQGGSTPPPGRRQSAKQVDLPWSMTTKSNDRWRHLLATIPKYEQVVIGKTGKMALLRTVDPRVFAELSHAVGSTSDRVFEQAQSHLVDRMLKEHLVLSKVSDAQYKALGHDIEAIVREKALAAL